MDYMDNIGDETIEKEFKIFNFYNIGLELSNEDAIDLISNKKWIFNNCVIKNIKSMISIYLPKYTCAYLSNKLNKDCTLYFGIDDIGNLKGIHYQGIIDENDINNHIQEQLNNNILCETPNINIHDYISCEIIKINYSNISQLDVEHPYLQKYLKLREEYIKKKEKYMKKKEIWNKLTLRYNQKLIDLLNNEETRQELINYIELKSPLNPVIKLLKSDIIFECCSTKEILMFKNDYNSIYHWVIEWKDKMLLFVKSIRPSFFFKIPSHVHPTSILMSIDPMLAYWFKFNQNMNLYLIKFNFKSQNKLKLQYKNIYNEWTSCIRLVNENGPSCQHISYNSIYN